MDNLQKVCVSYQAEKVFFTERKPIAVFRRPHSAAIIWKQSFSKTQGKFVAEMVLVYEDKRFLVDHAMVF